MSIKKQIVVGMSGHIDHGKTSIVKLLTGKNTDTLKQEQDRGMTIDLGFAFLDEKITIIDVPGHEKFIKNKYKIFSKEEPIFKNELIS